MILQVALVGAGGFGQVHLSNLIRLEEAGELRIAAIVEPKGKDALGAGESLSGYRFFHRFEDFMAAGMDIDAVILAAPLPYHFAMTLACLEAGYRIYLEKPPVATLKDLETLCALEKEPRIFVGFNMSLWPCMLRLRALVESQVLGQLESIAAHAVWPRGSYYYDRADWAGRLDLNGSWVFDGPASNALAHLIFAITDLGGAALGLATPSLPEVAEGEYWRVRPIESYDTVSLRGVLQGGIRYGAAFTHASRHLNHARLELRFSRGSAWFEVEGRKAGWQGPGIHEEIGLTPGLSSLHAAYEHFFAFCRDPHHRPIVRLADCRGFHALLQEAYSFQNCIRQIPSLAYDFDPQLPEEYNLHDAGSMMQTCALERQLLSEVSPAWLPEGDTVSGLMDSVGSVRSQSL